VGSLCGLHIKKTALRFFQVRVAERSLSTSTAVDGRLRRY
jgi:hypothetical protein